MRRHQERSAVQAGYRRTGSIRPRPARRSGYASAARGTAPGAKPIPATGAAALPGERVLAGDRDWPRRFRFAVWSACALLGALLLLDGAAGTLTPVRGLVWAAFALAAFAVLLPRRVTAGDGWLAVRGPLREQRVDTARLVSVWSAHGTEPRLVLRDASGARAEFDPRVLADNPLLWHRLDVGARRARAAGLLVEGVPVLRELAETIDGGSAREILALPARQQDQREDQQQDRRQDRRENA